MSFLNNFFNENVNEYLHAGGYETRSRLLKLLPSGDVRKMEEELEIYLSLLRTLLENSDLDEARQMALYMFAQISAVAVNCEVDDWQSKDIKQAFFSGVDEATSVDELVTLCRNAILAFTEMIGQQRREHNYSALVQEICKYVYVYIDEKLTLDRIAEHFHFCKSYITHQFKKETGMTIGDYILEQRIIAAQSLLCQGLSISQVAVQLGFVSQSHFTKAFRRKTGQSPNQWRKSQNT